MDRTPRTGKRKLRHGVLRSLLPNHTPRWVGSLEGEPRGRGGTLPGSPPSPQLPGATTKRMACQHHGPTRVLELGLRSSCPAAPGAKRGEKGGSPGRTRSRAGSPKPAALRCHAHLLPPSCLQPPRLQHGPRYLGRARGLSAVSGGPGPGRAHSLRARGCGRTDRRAGLPLQPLSSPNQHCARPAPALGKRGGGGRKRGRTREKGQGEGRPAQGRRDPHLLRPKPAPEPWQPPCPPPARTSSPPPPRCPQVPPQPRASGPPRALAPRPQRGRRTGRRGLRPLPGGGVRSGAGGEACPSPTSLPAPRKGCPVRGCPESPRRAGGEGGAAGGETVGAWGSGTRRLPLPSPGTQGSEGSLRPRERGSPRGRAAGPGGTRSRPSEATAGCPLPGVTPSLRAADPERGFGELGDPREPDPRPAAPADTPASPSAALVLREPVGPGGAAVAAAEGPASCSAGSAPPASAPPLRPLPRDGGRGSALPGAHTRVPGPAAGGGGGVLAMLGRRRGSGPPAAGGGSADASGAARRVPCAAAGRRAWCRPERR